MRSCLSCGGPGSCVLLHRLAECLPFVWPSRLKPGAVDCLSNCLDGWFPWDFVRWVTDLTRLVYGFDPYFGAGRMCVLCLFDPKVGYLPTWFLRHSHSLVSVSLGVGCVCVG